MEKEIMALSLMQPWPELFFFGKDVENRNWNTNYRGLLIIHASKTFDPSAWQSERIKNLIPPTLKPDPAQYQMGGFVAVCTLEDVVTSSASPWFFGKYGFVLKNFRRLDFYPYPGQRGLFKVSEDLLTKLGIRRGEQPLPGQISLF